MPISVTIDRGIKSITRGVPGPPGDLTQPFTSITFDTVNPDAPDNIAQMTWDAEDETLEFRQNGTTLQIGQEQQWPTVNKSGADIVNGLPVMAAGTTGATGRINIVLMDGTDTNNAKRFIGLTTEDIDDQSNGKVSTFGKVRDIQTDGGQYSETWVDGDIVYISPTTIGELTNIQPSAGQLVMPCAFVINAHVSSGVLAVRVTPIDEGLTPTKDEKAAMTGANAPDASNVFATIADVDGGGGGTETLVAAFTSVGSETQISFPLLSGNKYLRLEVDLAAPMVGNPLISLTVNGDVNSTGYSTERSQGFSAFTTLSNNSDIIRGFAGNDQFQSITNIVAGPNGFLAETRSVRAEHTVGSSQMLYFHTRKSGDFSSGVSQVDIFSTSAMTAGMTFRLFEIQEAP